MFVINVYEQIAIVVGVIIVIILVINWRVHKTKLVDNAPPSNTVTSNKNINSIVKKYNLKVLSDNSIILTKFISKNTMEQLKQELLPFGFVWDEENEKFTQTGGLSSIDAKSIIEVFDLFDERLVKLEKAVLGNSLSDPSVSLPQGIKPILGRIEKLEEMINESASSKVEDKKDNKKEEIDLSFFSEPRTPDEVVQRFNFLSKQGLYLKLASYGVSRNGDGNYYIPEPPK